MKLNLSLQPEQTGSERGCIVKRPPIWRKLWLQYLPFLPQLMVRQKTCTLVVSCVRQITAATSYGDVAESWPRQWCPSHPLGKIALTPHAHFLYCTG